MDLAPVAGEKAGMGTWWVASLQIMLYVGNGEASEDFRIEILKVN